LNELSLVLFRRSHETRYLRQHVGTHRRTQTEEQPSLNSGAPEIE